MEGFINSLTEYWKLILPICFVLLLMVFWKQLRSIFKKMSPKDFEGTSAVLCLFGALIGLCLIVASYFYSKQNEQFYAYISASIGSLLAASFIYSCCSEYFLKKHFLNELTSTIDHKLTTNKRCDSVCAFGLQEISGWHTHDLLNKMESSKSCTCVALYFTDIFESHHERLVQMINNGLELTVIMLNPSCEENITAIANGFQGYDPSMLKHKIDRIVKHFLIKRILKELSDDAQGKLEIRCADWPLPYSAYVFDKKEMWFLPRHASKVKNDAPTYFSISGETLANNFYYKDVISLRDKYSQKMNLSVGQ
ncbi:hypothetical protein [Halodesulfovibrio spirochaetisodalis]|uniref:Uncharacterized protein n=1 Tax=Halodesulfovibrio spirochaetisodalis TaxID=1560234 RepID=A0A1B7XMM7_9BACT|nr:hypothetical protein [Halodesulfovibrio spirochaetisodalis]OBQ56762.1 hypothetical protein SP90_01365 [Halodesulfovibrio spirochaetisodalis]